VNEPLVSVILPTYNRRKYLDQAVQSVLVQTEPRWELIVADDGSTDDTRAWLATVNDPRVVTLPLAHSGHPGKTRNAALPRARGRYVAFLDSDDWWAPDKLAAQLDLLTRRPECRWSYTWYRSVDAAGIELPPVSLPARDGWILALLLAGDITIITPSVLAEAALLREAGAFDESLPVASHLDLWARLAARSPVALLAEPAVTRRTHADNYGRRFRDSLPDIERVWNHLLSHAQTGSDRNAVRRRRTRWLTESAARQRVAGETRLAWTSMRAALPSGLLSVAWWSEGLKLLFRSVIPQRAAASRR